MGEGWARALRVSGLPMVFERKVTSHLARLDLDMSGTVAIEILSGVAIQARRGRADAAMGDGGLRR